MADLLLLRILENGLSVYETSLTAAVELGRQQSGEPAAYTWLPAHGSASARLVVAHQDERDNISRHHALLEPLPSGGVRLTNRSKAPLPCDGVPAGSIAPGAPTELMCPFSVTLAGRTITVGPSDSKEPIGLRSLDEQAAGPGSLGELSGRLRSLPALAATQLNDVVAWLQTTMGVLQSTVGAADFLDKATEALVQIVGLDCGRVLLSEGDQWLVAATYGAPPGESSSWQPSRHVLTQVRDKKKTFWQSARPVGSADTPSLELLQTLVAAPILDADGKVVGALYGERRMTATPRLFAVSGKLEAVLVELLACGVATGLARQAQEKAALQAQVRFEQFFGL